MGREGGRNKEGRKKKKKEGREKLRGKGRIKRMLSYWR